SSKMTAGVPSSGSGGVATAPVVVDSTSTTVLGSSAANRIHLVSRQWPEESLASAATNTSRPGQLSPLSLSSRQHSPTSTSSSLRVLPSPPSSSSNSPSHLPHL